MSLYLSKMNLRLLFLFLLLPSLAHAGEKIAFSRLTDGYWQIWAMEADGSDANQLTFSNYDKRDPAWLDHNRIAFRTSNSQFFILDLKGAVEEQFLKKYGVLNSPSYCGKTDEVLFVRFDPRSTVDVSDIWKARLDGQDARILTKDNFVKFQASFSSDGEHIAFVRSSEDRRHYHVWMMDAQGSDARQLTKGERSDLLPRFSPDRKRLTFTTNIDGNFNIYTLDLGSLRQKRLTDDSGLDTDSSFSPDGQHIAFVSNRSGNQQVWTMDADGKDLKQLTQDEHEAIDPDWILIPEEEN